jgi:hypothetical protein
MSVRSNRSDVKRPARDRKKATSVKPAAQPSEWELNDDLLDEALRQTFPASDALSMIRCSR